jgi:DNA-binding protein H-NS
MAGKTLLQLEAEIEKLQAQAAQLEQERSAALSTIKELMSTHEISIDELKPKRMARVKTKTSKKRKFKAASQARIQQLQDGYVYSDGENQWNGRGRRPQWLLEQINNGKNPDHLIIRM